jgi:hypothetical protein
MAEQTSNAPTLSRTGRILRRVWLTLLAFNLVMLIVTIPPLLRGEPDAYHNQHARSVASAVSGLLLVSTFLVRPPKNWVLLVAAFLSLGVQFVLAFR